MNLTEFVASDTRRLHLEEGAKIPWDDPDFSRRMLANHLDQDHDWASRNRTLIAAHTACLAGRLRRAPSRILDLGCGPGLYTQALAKMGHICTGVDFSPASIDYARQQAAASGLNIEYVQCDVRGYRSETKFDCILMTFGEFNVFTRHDACGILENSAAMLHENGLFVLEAHTYEAVKGIGKAPPSWQRAAKGLFSDSPHLCLQENTWHEYNSSAVTWFFIVDALTAAVHSYASFMQAYTREEYETLLSAAALPCKEILREEAWPPGKDFQGRLEVFVCEKADM